MFDDRELDTLYEIFEGFNNCYLYVFDKDGKTSDGVFFDATPEHITSFILMYKNKAIGLLITDTIDREMLRVQFEPNDILNPVKLHYGERWRLRTDLQVDIANQLLSLKEPVRFPVVSKTVYEEYCDMTERAAEYAEYYGEK